VTTNIFIIAVPNAISSCSPNRRNDHPRLGRRLSVAGKQAYPQGHQASISIHYTLPSSSNGFDRSALCTCGQDKIRVGINDSGSQMINAGAADLKGSCDHGPTLRCLVAANWSGGRPSSLKSPMYCDESGPGTSARKPPPLNSTTSQKLTIRCRY
jgi:hypothetical protein